MVMERLTKRIDGGLVFPNELIGVMMTPSNDTMCRILTRLAAYEDTGLEPEDMAHWMDYFRAECEGRLVVLPCKVGDHVWIDGRDAIVTEFFGYRSERYFHAVILGRNKHIDIPFDEIGKTVFLTREDAEAALKGGEG